MSNSFKPVFFQLDVLQGDTFYDMVERSDIDVVKSNLDIENNSSSGNFKDFLKHVKV